MEVCRWGSMAQAQVEIEEETPKAAGQGRRQEARQPYKANASLCRAGTPILHQAVVIDLSCTGSLLRLVQKADFEVNDMIDLSVQSSDLSFRARGSIRQIREDGVLLGIRLENLTSRGKALLNNLIQELESGIVILSQR